MELRFCYRIAAAAELAHDTVTREPAEAYVQMKIDAQKQPENYEAMHTSIGSGLSRQHGWQPEWVIPISTEEYDRETEEEDESDH